MNEKLTPQKERFLQELERKLLRKELDARLLENGLLTRTSSMNLILGIAFVPVTAASIVSAVRARREDA